MSLAGDTPPLQERPLQFPHQKAKPLVVVLVIFTAAFEGYSRVN